jgi:hypothetical protein
MPNLQSTHQSIPVALLAGGLVVYCIAVILMFRKDKQGMRRRWLPLDFIWVPLGGLTVLTLLTLWWQHTR